MSRAYEELEFAPRFDLRRGFEAYIEDWRARTPADHNGH